MIIETTLSPAFLLIAGALLIPFLKRGRGVILLSFPLLALIWIWFAEAPTDISTHVSFLGEQIQLFAPSPLGRLFATIFAIASLIGNLFALRQANKTELSAALLYAGSAIGVALCGDFLSLFIFWELMAIGSTLIIFSANTASAEGAGFRYLLIHVLSGVLLLAGILGLSVDTGSLALRSLSTDTIYAWLILAGILINAGAPPLSAWISDAYPEASPSGTVFLSAFTTKSAVFALLVVFPGETILIPFGLYMIFYGIIYALLENDMRRILTYSIVNQVGFMVVGIGIGTTLSLNGAAFHAFAHIIYKALLLMSAGSVLWMTARRQCTQLGGLYHSMRLTTVCAIIGALAISSFPLTSGFISKPMISQAALNIEWVWLWLLLMTASAGVFLHAGVKFPWFVFFQKDSGLRPEDPPFNMKLAMVIASALCILIGIFPELLYTLQAWPVDFVPYTNAHVANKLQLLLFGGAAFFILLPLLKRTQTISLDTDWFYRLLIPTAAKQLQYLWEKIHQYLVRYITYAIHIIIMIFNRYLDSNHLLASNARSGAIAFGMILVVCFLLLLYY